MFRPMHAQNHGRAILHLIRSVCMCRG
jgi:hypothetical protein